jgi:hypothetical protein
MYAITADQVNSRHRPDIAEMTMRDLTDALGDGLVLPVDRTAGDEVQLLLDRADHALAVILRLTRGGEWSVGCGVGSVNTPLPANARAASGDAFVAAREAVTDAKKRDTRFALRTAPGPQTDLPAGDAEALVDLLLQLRGRRSAEGWQMFDLMASGNSQVDSARRLGISPQAASKRARTAALRVEFAAIGPLERMLAAVDTSATRRSAP